MQEWYSPFEPNAIFKKSRYSFYFVLNILLQYFYWYNEKNQYNVYLHAISEFFLSIIPLFHCSTWNLFIFRMNHFLYKYSILFWGKVTQSCTWHDSGCSSLDTWSLLPESNSHSVVISSGLVTRSHCRYSLPQSRSWNLLMNLLPEKMRQTWGLPPHSNKTIF